MSENLKKIAIGLYVIVGLVTFGHAAAASDRYHAKCLQEGGEHAFCPINSPPVGLISAALWPLYWSWEAWS